MDDYLKEANSDNCICGADCGETVPDLRCGIEILLNYLEGMMEAAVLS
jgi:hypothetical protein